MNLSEIKITTLTNNPKTLDNLECFNLCKDTQFQIFIEPFILLGLSILFSWVSWYITENYEMLSIKFPNHIKQIQNFYSYCSWASLFCQCSLGIWIIYIITYGIN